MKSNTKGKKNVEKRKKDKDVRKVKLIITVVVLLFIAWFLVISPLIKFKNDEKQVKNAAIRYYEVNNRELPTGKKINTVTLQKLYDKDYITEDIKSPYLSKSCDEKASWVKVRKENNEYKYYVYLKCGILSSKVDHKGPEINLNGNDIVTVNKGEEYKDAGIKSVIDNTDGNIDPKNVTIDTSKVNTNKNGTYSITYKIRDSFGNQTIKERIVKVEQILNKIVEKDTSGINVYKGNTENNYIKLDGILFKIIGINSDGSVKIVSSDALAAVDYNGVDEWLNNYFYNKLSDSAKEYIVNSKWCNENISNPENYNECNSYSKKKNVGLLSVADINNSKGEDGSYNVTILKKSWTSNIKSSDKSVAYNGSYSSEKNSTNIPIYPTINIKKNAFVTSGNGNYDNPYKLKGNNKKIKIGDNISSAEIGKYIDYSGYRWRIIGKEDDDTTKIIMDEVVKTDSGDFNTNYTNKSIIKFDSKEKNSIGYKINNEIPTYIKTNLFAKRQNKVLDYNKTISYNGAISNKTYTSKLHLPSIYEIFSITVSEGYYWYLDHSSSSNTYCIVSSENGIYSGKFNPSITANIRLIGYLDKNVTIKNGNGSIRSPYKLTK